MSHTQTQLLAPDEEADEAFALHAGEIVPEELIEELEDENLAEEEAAEVELEEELGLETEELDEEEEPEDREDVEASLDELLLIRTIGDEELQDLESLYEPEVLPDDTQYVAPRHRDEFVCRSCFLVKSRGQLADRRRHLCLDCV